MTTLADAPLSTLTDNLSDFLDLPAVLDLPEVARVELHRSRGDSGWTVKAQLAGRWGITDQDIYEDIRAWAGSGEVEFGPVVQDASRPWRRISTVVSFVGVQVTVWAHVSGDFEPPQSEADQVAAALLLEASGAGEDGS